MGFWSTLGKIGSVAAAPFTGGASLSAMPMIDALSKGTGNASQGMASNRGTKAEIMLDQNRDLENQLLQREQDKREARRSAYADAMRGRLGAEFKPAPRPSYMGPSYTQGSSPETIAAADMLYKQGMDRMGQKDLTTPGGMPEYRNLWNDPEFKKTLNPGKMEKFMGLFSAFSPLLGAFKKGGGTVNPGKYTPSSTVGISPNMPGFSTDNPMPFDPAAIAAAKEKYFGGSPFNGRTPSVPGYTPSKGF